MSDILSKNAEMLRNSCEHDNRSSDELVIEGYEAALHGCLCCQHDEIERLNAGHEKLVESARQWRVAWQKFCDRPDQHLRSFEDTRACYDLAEAIDALATNPDSTGWPEMPLGEQRERPHDGGEQIHGPES